MVIMRASAVLLLTIFIFGQSQPPSPTSSKSAHANQKKAKPEQDKSCTDDDTTKELTSAINQLTAVIAARNEQHFAVQSNNKTPAPRWLIASTIVSALATLAIAVLGYFQWRAMHRQAGFMQNGLLLTQQSADAATVGAQAATASVDAMNKIAISQLRAYVGIKEIKALSHLHPEGHYWWSIAPVFENTGATPAMNVLINVNSKTGDNPLPDDWAFPRFAGEDVPSIMMPKSLTAGAEVQINGDDLLAVKEGRKYAYIWGSVSYRDVFPGTPRRTTKFCVELSCRGNPAMPISNDNIVEFVGKQYPKHNCADDDCAPDG